MAVSKSTTNDVCPNCGVAMANHVCPQRVGTVPGVIATVQRNGATVTTVVRAATSRPACARCGRPNGHANERGWQVMCTIEAAYKWAGQTMPSSVGGAFANDPAVYALVGQYLASQTAQVVVPASTGKTATAVKVAKAQNTPVNHVTVAPTSEAPGIPVISEKSPEAPKAMSKAEKKAALKAAR